MQTTLHSNTSVDPDKNRPPLGATVKWLLCKNLQCMRHNTIHQFTVSKAHTRMVSSCDADNKILSPSPYRSCVTLEQERIRMIYLAYLHGTQPFRVRKAHFRRKGRSIYIHIHIHMHIHITRYSNHGSAERSCAVLGYDSPPPNMRNIQMMSRQSLSTCRASSFSFLLCKTAS